MDSILFGWMSTTVVFSDVVGLHRGACLLRKLHGELSLIMESEDEDGSWNKMTIFKWNMENLYWMTYIYINDHFNANYYVMKFVKYDNFNYNNINFYICIPGLIIHHLIYACVW